jgi:hypothetical protein
MEWSITIQHYARMAKNIPESMLPYATAEPSKPKQSKVEMIRNTALHQSAKTQWRQPWRSGVVMRSTLFATASIQLINEALETKVQSRQHISRTLRLCTHLRHERFKMLTPGERR